LKKDLEKAIQECEQGLIATFARWDYLFAHGGNDPTWPDGVNLNLVRNHIISYKRQMDKLLAEEEQSFTLFKSSYPDIYYRETPEKVSDNFMVKADEIRTRAREQLALYEQDSNFCYIRDNAQHIFQAGETKATRAAGLYPATTSGLIWYRKIIEQDDLVAMRSRFYRPYEEKAAQWSALANKLKNYLETDHSKEDDVPLQDEEDALDRLSEELEESVSVERPVSLDEQIRKAEEKSSTSVKSRIREEQISFF